MFSADQVSGTEERHHPADPVQSAGHCRQNVRRPVRLGGDASELQDVPAPKNLLHAGTPDGHVPLVCQVAPLPHPPQVKTLVHKMNEHFHFTFCFLFLH